MIGLLLLASGVHIGRTFFVDPAGNDAADGLSRAQAWRSLSKVSATRLVAGDTVILTSGAQFNGSLVISNGGTATAPVVVRSSGREPATILSTDKPAIQVRCGGVEIRSLKLLGGAGRAVKDHVGLLLSAAGPLSHVKVSDVDISGFGAQGISIACDKGAIHGFTDLMIDHAKVHGNYATGIESGDGTAYLDKGYSHKGFRITDCDVSDNFGGNGIILSGVDGALVEYCRAADNHGSAGSLGMWCWCARHVVFRYCIASGTRGKADSGGFDLDGGARYCRAEKCLSYDNDGPGYMHCDYPWAPRTERNSFVDCISIDDGRRGGDQAIGFGFVVWGSGLYDCTVEHNLAVLSTPVQGAKDGGILFATFIRSEEMPLEKQRLDGAVFRDNTVQVGPDADFIRNNFPQRHLADVVFVGNRYGGQGGLGFAEGPNTKLVRMTQAEWAHEYPSDADSKRRFAVKIGDYRSVKPRDLQAYLKSVFRS